MYQSIAFLAEYRETFGKRPEEAVVNGGRHGLANVGVTDLLELLSDCVETVEEPTEDCLHALLSSQNGLLLHGHPFQECQHRVDQSLTCHVGAPTRIAGQTIENAVMLA